MDLEQNLFILGDLNQDLLSSDGKLLAEFIKNYDFTQHVKAFTRVATKHFKASNTFKTSRSLLDVVIHNKDLVKKTLVSYCPFSDHKFVVALLEFKSAKPVESSNMLRKLSVKNLENIKLIIDNTDFSDINLSDLTDDRWILLKNRILDVVNTIAPVKKIKSKNQDENFP